MYNVYKASSHVVSKETVCLSFMNIGIFEFSELPIYENIVTINNINYIKKGKLKMEKVVLKDGTELEICNGATENTLTMELTEENTVETLVSIMTEENLSEYKILTESGIECTTIKDKYVKSYTVNTEENTVRFHLADVDTVSKRLAELEATQEMQDEAIMELATMAAESEE